MRTLARALSLLLLVGPAASLARADGPNGPVEYPREWGPNYASHESGTRVAETSSNATAPECLNDGSAIEGRHWEPAWSRGLPAFFTFKLTRAERVNKMVLTTRSSGAGFPRECELWVGKSLAELHSERTFALPNKSQQIVDFEPVEGQFLKLVIKSTWKEEETEVGEAAFFFHGATPPRAHEAKDQVELRVGDKLLGEVIEDTFRIRTRFGELTLKRDQLVGVSLDEGENDRVFLRTGEIATGELALSSVHVRLDSGQTVELARARVGSVALKKSAGDFPGRTEELLGRGAVFNLGDSERWVGKISVPSLRLQTAFGAVELPIESLQAFDVGQGTEVLDKVTLRNGDVLRGLLAIEELPIQLAVGREAKVAKSLLTRVVLAKEPEGAALGSAPENQRFVLRTGDVLSGVLKLEKLKVRTSYAALELDLTAIERLDTAEIGKMRAVLRDGTSVVGRVSPEVLPVELDAGGTARIPVDRLTALENWRLPADTAAQVDELVKKLDDASWPVREAAKGDLLKLGKIVIPRVSRLLRTGTPESKRSASEILAGLKEAPAEPSAPGEEEKK